MQVVVDQGQSLFDIAVQHCGDAVAAYDLALLNGISITADLKPGSYLLRSDVVDVNVVKYYTVNGIIPATAITLTGQVITPEGIDYWGIGIDFIIS